MDTHSLTRRTCLLGLLATLAGCNRAEQPKVAKALVCPPQTPLPITHKLLVDRTTVVPDGMQAQVARFIARLSGPATRLQVLSFGGVTPHLIREEFQIQLPAPEPTAQQRESDRWDKSPEQIRNAEDCRKRDWAALQLASQIQAVLADVDNTVQARSPIFEAISSACQGWQAGTLVLWSNGVEHHGPGRSFYGRGGLAVPEASDWLPVLKAEGLMPALHQVEVFHLAMGLSEESGPQRRIRHHAETAALKKLWAAYWAQAGARSLVIGEPLPVGV